jgi:malonyl-CoA/methylmalonyl-CoA synthetase
MASAYRSALSLHSERSASIGSIGAVSYNGMMSSSSEPALTSAPGRWPDRDAVRSGATRHRYRELGEAADAVAAHLLGPLPDLGEGRVAYLIPPSFEHVALQWGIWRAGGVAVPVAVSHPPAEIAALLQDAAPAVLVASAGLLDRARQAAAGRDVMVIPASALLAQPQVRAALPDIETGRRALIVYTSGTTGRPKGVVSTHANLDAQSRVLIDAWGWCADDWILHVLPLHHVHGIVNALSCPLRVGACVEFMSFDAEAVWDRLASGEITVFMGVPTVYSRLLQAWEGASPPIREQWSAGASRLRLMVSGSAALPEPVFERWRVATGQSLLERYGMTEIGMALSNPFDGARVPGTVGAPLPGVEARIVDPEGRVLEAGASGEIEIRGPQVFGEYWDRPAETRAVFRDGWFRTGDEGRVDAAGRWRILGRRSVDILKTGGHKVSALEVERRLIEHPAVVEVAVVGVPDPDWGDRVCAAVVLAAGAGPTAEQLREWCKERMAPYKVPRTFRFVEQLPCNALGKVVKPKLARLFD